MASLPSLSGSLLPMTLPEEGTHLRNLCNHALSANHLKPDIYVEINEPEIALRLALLGECAAILPRSSVTDPRLEIHSLPEPCYFFIVAACRKNMRLPLIREAIREMEELF